jgi:transmembrane sensor
LSEWLKLLGLRRRSAAQRFLRSKAGHVTAAEERKLTQWLAKGNHEREYALMEAVWQLSGELKGDPAVDRLSVGVPAWASSRRSGPRAWAVAAAVVAVPILLVSRIVLMPSEQAYRTGVGEQRTVILSDGSQVFMNTASALQIEYSLLRRVVRLESGEATFEVAKNKHRPFEVVTKMGTSRALGTKFDVFVRPTSMEVAIVEGTVGVRSNGPTGEARMVIVHSGQLATVKSDARVVVGRADLDRILSRRVEQLEFDNVPLSSVLAEFNHYADKPVLAATADISARRISGVFHAADTIGFVSSLTASLKLYAIGTDTSVILAREPLSEPTR